MSEFLPKELREELALALKRKAERKNRLRVQADDSIYRVRRLWDGGFAMDSEGAPFLRGLVDLYDGSRHLYRCLIIASERAAGEMVYEFKRLTAAVDRAPRDYIVDENAPTALIAHH